MSGQQTPQTSFVQRRIDCTFALGTGTFGDDPGNVVTVKGHRCVANIVKSGGVSMGAMQLRIYGMQLSQMNKLSTLGKVPLSLRNNTVSVSAGDKMAGMGTCFEGTIATAWSDFSGAPDSVFHVTAMAGLIQAVKPIAASSYTGPTDVATIMASLANQMGLTFENSGVSVMLATPYLPGTARQQAEACARAADINWIIDGGKLAIWPRGGSRGGKIPLISPSTGLRGYPAYNSTGIIVQCVYNPSIGYGSQIEVKSSLTPANGKWIVYGLDYDLASEMPDGDWFMTIKAAPPGLAPIQ